MIMASPPSQSVPTILLPDALSTTVFALGEEKGLELLNRLDGVEGFVVREDLSIHKSENF